MFIFTSRDALKRQYNLRQFYLEVNVEDVAAFDETLAEKLKKAPTEHIPLVSSFFPVLLFMTSSIIISFSYDTWCDLSKLIDVEYKM